MKAFDDIIEFCSSSGYYDTFIPAMRRLSPMYNEYYEQMIKANEQFVREHPEYIDKFEVGKEENTRRI